eukprot:868318-Pyramimonas_sp.AAC.1
MASCPDRPSVNHLQDNHGLFLVLVVVGVSGCCYLLFVVGDNGCNDGNVMLMIKMMMVMMMTKTVLMMEIMM